MTAEQTSYTALLGVVLANLRQQKGIDQGVMAQAMGLSQASYSRLESGKSTFTVDQMFQAAHALGTTVRELLDQIENLTLRLQMHNVTVTPQIRGNSTQGQQEGMGVGSLVAGAALGAILIGILGKK